MGDWDTSWNPFFHQSNSDRSMITSKNGVRKDGCIFKAYKKGHEMTNEQRAVAESPANQTPSLWISPNPKAHCRGSDIEQAG